MARKKKQAEASAGAPEWMVTFGDMMSLLLCFFVIIVSMSEIKKDEKFQQVMQSLRKAFGNSGEIHTVISEPLDPNSLLQKLQEIVIPPKPDRGDADDPGIQGRVFRVTDVREGIHVEIGGRITFDRFSDVLKPEAERLIEQVGAKTVGHNTIIKITGHTTREPLPKDSAWSDQWALSYARAESVKRVLVRNGIRPARLRLVAAGAEAPVLRQAYEEREIALNRRVEIVVTEATIDDYNDSEKKKEMQETTDG
ncbi:MAG: MotB [Phycisphaerae bacterium]|nr:MAG: MotB [Phycisphaerae bacterium]